MAAIQGDGTERWHGTPGGRTNHKCNCDRCKVAWNASVRHARDVRRSRPFPEGVLHGTPNAYDNYECRCRVCRDVHSSRMRRERLRRASNPLPAHVQHGIPLAYFGYGCRCQLCRDAGRLKNAKYRKLRKERADAA